MLTETIPGPTGANGNPNRELSATLAETQRIITEVSVAAETAGVDQRSFMGMFLYGRQAGVTPEQMSRALASYKDVGGPSGFALRAFGLSGLSGQELLVAYAGFNNTFTDLGMKPPDAKELPQFLLQTGTQMMLQAVLMYGNTATDALRVLEATLHAPVDDANSPEATSQK